MVPTSLIDNVIFIDRQTYVNQSLKKFPKPFKKLSILSVLLIYGRH